MAEPNVNTGLHISQEEDSSENYCMDTSQNIGCAPFQFEPEREEAEEERGGEVGQTADQSTTS